MIEIGSFQCVEGGIVIAFMDSDDIRCEGDVFLTKSLQISHESIYAPAIQDIVNDIHELIVDATRDHAQSAVYDPALEDEDDED